MKLNFRTGLLALGITFLAGTVGAQTISKEELVFLTSEWKGERFPDGRPKISNELIERAKNIGTEEAWQILNNEGYRNQFDSGWKMIHEDVPIVGRAVTAAYMPSRPDVEKSIKDRGLKQGRKGNTNSWTLDVLQKGDVYVADGFGKIAEGTMIGDNLGNSIYSKTGNGVILNSSARDRDGLKKIEGFNAFVRDWDPSYLKDVVLMGLNTPVRIGRAIVLPGDLVLGKSEGVVFIPAHMAEKVILTAEFIGLRDTFGIQMLKEDKYSPGEIDNQWTDTIKNDFIKWLDKNPGKIPMTRAQLDDYMKSRTW